MEGDGFIFLYVRDVRFLCFERIIQGNISRFIHLLLRTRIWIENFVQSPCIQPRNQSFIPESTMHQTYFFGRITVVGELKVHRPTIPPWEVI